MEKWCPKCQRYIPDPGGYEISKCAKFWRDNRCYYCDSPLYPAPSSKEKVHGMSKERIREEIADLRQQIGEAEDDARKLELEMQELARERERQSSKGGYPNISEDTIDARWDSIERTHSVVIPELWGKIEYLKSLL